MFRRKEEQGSSFQKDGESQASTITILSLPQLSFNQSI
jgi:hypothetical protein